MKNYKAIFFIAAACSFHASYAQEENETGEQVRINPKIEENVFSGILYFNSWINKLNTKYKKLIAEEKREECLRKLAYIGNDLQELANKKRKFILDIKRENYTKLQEGVVEMATTMDEIIVNINDMNELINDVGRMREESVDMLELDLLYEKGYAHIAMSQDIRSGNFVGFQSNTEKAIKLLDRSAQLVWTLRKNILQNQ